MDKQQVIKNLEQMAILMELCGENSFKIRAHHSAIRTLEGEIRPLSEIIEKKELQKLKGIGKGLAEKIEEMVTTGASTPLQQLQQKVAPGLVQMLGISGLGAKKIRALHKELGITTIAQLESACKKGEIAKLSGFAKKTEQNILAGIESLRRHSGLFYYSYAWQQAQEIIKHLQQNKGLQKIEVAGSLRRKKEVTKDVDILAAASDPNSLMNDFVNMPQINKVIGHGPTKSSIALDSGLQADLRVVELAQFPYALMYFTGSKEHNTAMRSEAKKKNWKLNEYGLFDKEEKLIVCKSEAEVFDKFGFSYIEPELRENLGELECSRENNLPKLLENDDLKGIFHMHTNYSDGKNTLLEMAQAVKARGFFYMGVSDHSQSLTVAGGMKPPEVRQQLAEIDALNKQLAPFRIFKGVESDILADGSLDYEDDLLREFDFVIASVHDLFRMSQQDMTKRVVKAIQNPFTTMLGHPTGRLLLKRDPYAIDMHAVLKAAAEAEVIVEINAHPSRLDMDWRLGKQAKALGIITCINPDAHSIENLDLMKYGVGIARKGWFETKRVFNSFSVEQVAAFLQKRKQKALKQGKSK